MERAGRRRARATVLACVVAGALGAACSGGAGSAGDASGEESPGAVRVGAGEAVQIRSISSLSSPTGNASRNYLDAAGLAVADYGPIHGRFAVELGEGLDDRCSPEGGEQAARAVLADRRVVGVIGTACSAAAAVASPLLSEAGLVMISPSNTAPSLTSDLAGNPGENHHPGYFRTAPNDLHQGEAVAAFVYRELGLRRAAAVHDGDAYTLGLATAFAGAFEDRGGVVTSLARLDREASDLTADLSALAGGGMQALFVALFTNLSRLVIEQRQEFAGLRDAALIASSDFIGDDFLTQPASAGIYMAGPDTRYGGNINDSTGRSADDVFERFVAQTGASPQQAFWAHAYDAATLLLEAVEASSHLDGDALVIDRAALRQHLRSVDGYGGLTGEISCDAFGDCGPAGQVVLHHEDPADPGAAASNIVFTHLP